MKVAEYIEKCKKEIGWDSDAEHEWSDILHAVAFQERCAKDGILTYDRDCNELKAKIRERIKKLDTKQARDESDMIDGGVGLVSDAILDELKGLVKNIWTDKHTKIVEESEEMFKTHTEGDEVNI